MTNLLKRLFEDKETKHEIAVIERYKRILDMQMCRYQETNIRFLNKKINEDIQKMNCNNNDFTIIDAYKGYSVTQILLRGSTKYKTIITSLTTNVIVAEFPKDSFLIGRQKANEFIDSLEIAKELMQAK